MDDDGGREDLPAICGLISGRGSNLQALLDATASGSLRARIAVVISNTAGAQGLERARTAGVEAITMNHRDFPDRDAFDTAIAAQLRSAYRCPHCGPAWITSRLRTAYPAA